MREDLNGRHLKGIAAVLLVGGMMLVAGCTGGGGGDGLSGSIEIAGSSTVFPVSQAMAEEFKKMHSGVDPSVKSTGTGAGFSNFFTLGKTDINDASRPIADSELQKARENGVEPIEFRVATDAVTVVMNPEATWTDGLTKEQLKQIWRPNDPAQKWSDIDPAWPDEEIQLYGPTSASGTFDFFTEEIMGEGGSSRSDYMATERDNEIVRGVSDNRYAIGYFGMAYYLENQESVKAVAVEGVKPSMETAKSGEYPLSRPLFIYVAESSLQEEHVREFVRFYLEQSSTELVSQIGYVPVTEETKQENLQKLEQAIGQSGASE